MHTLSFLIFRLELAKYIICLLFNTHLLTKPSLNALLLIGIGVQCVCMQGHSHQNSQAHFCFNYLSELILLNHLFAFVLDVSDIAESDASFIALITS